MKDRKIELQQNIQKKQKSGEELVGAQQFQNCFQFFITKSQFTDDLSDKDMQEI